MVSSASTLVIMPNSTLIKVTIIYRYIFCDMGFINISLASVIAFIFF